MKKLIFIIIVFWGCTKENIVNTNKNTYDDDISDITFLNGSFFTTNYDLSYNAGPQIDLFKFKYEDDSFSYLENSYSLGLNGQGYIAITNDGSDLFFQSNKNYPILKYSVVGELIDTFIDTIATNWQPCGITYNTENDSIINLYRNLNSPLEFRARTIPKDLKLSISSDLLFNLGFIDTSYYGVYAIEYYNLNYYMLGVDSTMNDILIITNNVFEVTSLDTISDNSVVGLSFKGNDLFLSYRDRRIEKFITFE